MGVLNERLFTITFGWKHTPFLKKEIECVMYFPVF